MSHKVHLLSDRNGRKVRTFCGRFGRTECGHEFTTMDGIESRLEYTDDEHAATCKNCLAAGARANQCRGTGTG